MARQRRSQPEKAAMSLERPDACLGDPRPPGRVDGVSMLDGYLTALIIGPCTI
jgi:hypothetical protein